MGQTLAEILDGAARGRFPAPDGSTTVVAAPSGRDSGVIAFTAHSVVFTDEDPAWVHATLASLDCDALAATMHPGSCRRSWSGPAGPPTRSTSSRSRPLSPAILRRPCGRSPTRCIPGS